MWMRNSMEPMRRNSNRQSVANAEKIKQRFSYQPSAEGKKCMSLIKNSHQTNTGGNDIINSRNSQNKENSNPQRVTDSGGKVHPPNQNINDKEINCEYSSVKFNKGQSNEYNDTSSWIEKLVCNIQEEDEKNLHKLSQIEVVSVQSDLPEDSQEYDQGEQNEFLMCEGKRLFTDETIPEIKEEEYSADSDHQRCNLNSKAVSCKKSKYACPQMMLRKNVRHSFIKQKSPLKQRQNVKVPKQVNQKVQTHEKSIAEGLKVPPVTRSSSFCKRQIQKKEGSHMVSVDKDIEQKDTAASSMALKKEQNAKNCKSQLHKMSSKRNKENIQPQVKKSLSKSKQPTEKSEFLLGEKTKTKKLSPHKVRRNNMIANKQRISLKKSEDSKSDLAHKVALVSKDKSCENNKCYILVRENSKDLNIEQLFDEGKGFLQKQEQIQRKPQTEQGTGSAKRVGSIRKNRHHTSNPSEDMVFHLKRDEKKLFDETENRSTSKKVQASQGKNIITKVFNQQHSLLQVNQLNEDIVIQQSDQSKQLSVKQLQSQKQEDLSSAVNLQSNPCEEVSAHIKEMFNRIRLSPGDKILSKNNMKLRGLTEDEKLQLGSIISKIHYSNASFTLQEFEKEYKSVNIYCTKSGYLSSKNLGRLSQASSSIRAKNSRHSSELANSKEQIKKYDEDYTPVDCLFDEPLQNFALNQNHASYRRNSKIVKKKLFEDMKKISALEKQTDSQILKCSEITQRRLSNSDAQGGKSVVEYIFAEKVNICKDPYIEESTVHQMALANKLLQQISHRSWQENNQSEANNSERQNHLNNLKKILNENQESVRKARQQKPESNSASAQKSNSKQQTEKKVSARDCMIEKLNHKLTEYISTNHLESTFKQFNLNFSELKKHIR